MCVPSLNEICENIFELSRTQVKMYSGDGGRETNISLTFIWGYNNNNTIMSQNYYVAFFRFLTNENIIFMSKILREWLKNCAPIQFLP